MPDDPIRDAWARQIALAHGGMAVVAVTASVNASVNAMIAMAIVYLFPPATALIVLTPGLGWAGRRAGVADEALYQAKREGRNRAFVRCLNSDRSSLAKNETR
jgi:GGDEF domain-containing protein